MDHIPISRQLKIFANSFLPLRFFLPGAGTHTNIIHEMCLCAFVVWNQFYTHHHDVNVENHIDLKVSHIRIAMKSVSLLTVGQFFPYFVQHTEDKGGGATKA